jgi:hypothetical protein
MENYILVGKHYKWPFSIATLNYQRVWGNFLGNPGNI